MARPRIHLVSPMWPAPDAPHRGVFVQSMASGLRNAGLDVETIALIRGHPSSVAARLRAHAQLGIGLVANSFDSADLLFVHGPSWFAAVAQASARPKSKGIAVHLHGGEVNPHSRVERWSSPLVARFLRSSDLVIAPSQDYAARAADRFDLRGERLFVSPSGGVDTGVFRPRNRAECRRYLDLWPDEPDRPILGFVGRLEPEKGTDVFMEVLAHLRRTHRTPAGVVVGAGSAAESMAKRARAGGLDVRFPGLLAQRSLPAYYAAFDALMFPTHAESLGLAAIEAMACGTPVIGSTVDAVPEYVRPGESGYLAPVGDVAAFTSHAERLISASSGERARLREGAIRMAERYERRAVMRALADRLKSLARALRGERTAER